MGGGGVAGALLLGTGCGGGDSGDLVFSMGPDASGTLTKLVDRFNRQNDSGARVRYREMPAEIDQYYEQLQTEFQAGGGEIDVVGGGLIWPAQFASRGWISDLSDRLPEDERQKFLPAPMQANTYEGNVYGVPWFTDAGMLYYRRDLLEESGFSEPPETWDELRDQAEKVRRDAGMQLGYVFQGAEYEGGVVNALEFIWNAGGDVLDGEEIVVDSPEAVRGLQDERDMVESGVAPEAVLTFKEDESGGAFLRGDAVFCRNWPYMYALLSDPEQSEIEPGQVGVGALPVSETGNRSFNSLGGWNFFLNAASADSDAGWEFVEFMSAPEQQKFRALEGAILPTLTGLYEDREILDKVPVIAQGVEAIKSSRPKPVTPYYSDMSLQMAEQFNLSLKGEKSPEQATADLREEILKIQEAAADA